MDCPRKLRVESCEGLRKLRLALGGGRRISLNLEIRRRALLALSDLVGLCSDAETDIPRCLRYMAEVIG